jgi:hypothetical protein
MMPILQARSVPQALGIAEKVRRSMRESPDGKPGLSLVERLRRIIIVPRPNPDQELPAIRWGRY